MTLLKQKIKQKLIEKQHKTYKNEISLRKITYEKWIAECEKTLKNDCTIEINEEKKLTNDLITKDFGRGKSENAGNRSDTDGFCRIMSFVDQKSHADEKTYFAHFDIKNINEKTINAFGRENVNFVIISVYNGRPTENAFAMICQCFQNTHTVLAYGDEDVLDGESGLRRDPWLKPDWSPDRFLSGFYFGGLIAVRYAALKRAWDYCKNKGIFEKQPTEGGEKERLYDVLFEMLRMQDCFSKRTEENTEKICHIKHVLYSGFEDGYGQIKSLKISRDMETENINNIRNISDKESEKDEREGKEDGHKNQMLSIIIPSKDNPEVLFHCIDSLLEKTRSSFPYEIIVVDNGSSNENRERISRKIEALDQFKNKKDQTFPHKAGEKAGEPRAESLFRGCRYLYEQMSFNFSKMCNLGAENAAGEVLLFLNDDMEIIAPKWMDLMMEKALLPYAGAVGAKLLYPDSDIIQHAGVTNLRVGPAHKLQYLSDKEDHYFGMNRGVHNMLAVTGACLMVRRQVFEEAGGFCEDLAVAFNDVDLCYSIYEMGYYNIVRNDVILYHHESLSRGKDGESEEKQLRHLKEKDLLYERHLPLYGKDPFYHPYLLNDMLDSKYSMSYCNQVTLDMAWSKLIPCEKELKKAREDECLVVGMECARDIYRWLYSISPEKGKIAAQPKDMGYYFQGYSFIIGADNACYKKKFLLKNKINGKVMAIAAENRYRQDIENNLPDQVNVGLTGFAAKLPKEAVPAGIYQFGILAEDQCSRQKLVNWSNWVMEVEADGRQSVREGKE